MGSPQKEFFGRVGIVEPCPMDVKSRLLPAKEPPPSMTMSSKNGNEVCSPAKRREKVQNCSKKWFRNEPGCLRFVRFHDRARVRRVAASQSGIRLPDVKLSALRWTHSSAAARSCALGGANYNGAERPPQDAAVVADPQPVQMSRIEWRRGEEARIVQALLERRCEAKEATVGVSPVLRLLQVRLTGIQRRGRRRVGRDGDYS